MINQLEKLITEKRKYSNNDLIYGAYLCEKLVHKLTEEYIKSNLEEDYDEIDKAFLSEEFRDLIDNEHLNDCNLIF